MEFVLELQETEAPESHLEATASNSGASLLLCGDSSLSVVTCN